MNLLSFVVFFLTFGLFLVGTNFIVYISVIKFFSLENWVGRRIILAVLIFLTLCFVASSILTHYKENAFSVGLYKFSAVWLGVFIYLFLSSLLLLLVWFLSKRFGIEYSPKFFGSLLLILSVLFSGYGFYNAKRIVVKEITVQIKNLPEQWQGKKAVQISDLHLGIFYGVDFIETLAEKINSAKPDIVFITGDLFDGMDGAINKLPQALDKINAPLGVYFVNGNHEIYLGTEKIQEVLNKTKIKTLEDEAVEIEGLQVLGMNFGSDVSQRNLTREIPLAKNYQSNKPTILLYHAPQNIAGAKNNGVNLQLSGHTHKGQLWPFGFITRIIFGKYHYGLNIEEDYSIYTSSGIGTWGPPMRTSSQPEIVVIRLLNK